MLSNLKILLIMNFKIIFVNSKGICMVLNNLLELGMIGLKLFFWKMIFKMGKIVTTLFFVKYKIVTTLFMLIYLDLLM